VNTERKAWWTSGSGRIELRIAESDISRGFHTGDCEDDVRSIAAEPYMAEQLATVNDDTLREHLAEYGAWNIDELSGRDANLRRLVWLACGDLFDTPDDELDFSEPCT
jgi:hypothetical protein